MNQREKAIQDTITKDLKEKTDFIFDSLVVNKSNSKLPEHLFKENFLPYFSGHQPITKESEVLSIWIGIAGTPMSEVDIIDQAGKVLYTVPSLFDTNIIKLSSQQNDNSFRGIFDQFDLHNNNIPMVANSYLRKALDNKFENMSQTSPVSETSEKRWADILSRYGLLLDTTDGTDSYTDQNLDDDLVYD